MRGGGNEVPPAVSVGVVVVVVVVVVAEDVEGDGGEGRFMLPEGSWRGVVDVEAVSTDAGDVAKEETRELLGVEDDDVDVDVDVDDKGVTALAPLRGDAVGATAVAAVGVVEVV